MYVHTHCTSTYALTMVFSESATATFPILMLGRHLQESHANNGCYSRGSFKCTKTSQSRGCLDSEVSKSGDWGTGGDVVL